MANLLPFPGLSQLVSVVNTIVRAATSYIDETLLSYNLARGDDNRFRGAKDGLIYYAQNAQTVLKTGLYIVLLDAALSALGWAACLVPAAVVAWFLPVGGGAQFLVVALAVLVGFNLRSAFFKPLFLIMVMIKFHVAAQNQPIQLEWDERLSGLSKHFVKLKSQAHHQISTPLSSQLPVVVAG